MSSELLNTLTASVKETVQQFDNGCDATSIHVIKQIRDCMVQLLGPFSEGTAWDLAVVRSVAFKEFDGSDNDSLQVCAEMRPDLMSDTNRRIVELDTLIFLYLNHIADLVGDEMLAAQLQNLIPASASFLSS